MEGREALGTRKKCCTWKKFWERNKICMNWLCAVVVPFHLQNTFYFCVGSFSFFLFLYLYLCLLSSSPSVRKSVRHPLSLFRSRCMYFSKCCCSSSPSSYSRSSLFWYDLHIPPITSPLVYITILCNAPSFLHRTCCACTWTCNDKFYWKVSLTRIFISSSSFTVAIANNLPSI